MRSMKKIIALVMVAMMLVAACVINAFAEEKYDYTDAAKRLGAINVMKGDKNGNLMLDQGVTRYQAALFFVQATTGETDVEKWNADKQSETFADVPEYGTAIDYANGVGLIRGRGDGTYGYNDPITYQDMLVLAVRALGYETDKMSYPLDYIKVAKRIKLTDKLDESIGYKQALTRGETAQIIWNMLETYMAVKDPFGGNILYPDDLSAAAALFDKYGIILDRTTLLEEAGFSQGVITATVVKYTEPKLSKDIATVTLDNGLVIAASDLGITARTNLSTFLGLPVTLYVDCKADEFDIRYSLDEELSEANILFVGTLDLTNVVNVKDQTNIKVVTRDDGEVRVTLGSETFGSKYTITVYTIDAKKGWQIDSTNSFYTNFAYEKDKFVGGNSYGEVDYAVTVDEVAKTYDVTILYKPYDFGQYYTRTIQYQPTVSEESFITIGKYDPTAIVYGSSGSINKTASYKNPGDKYAYFVEYLLGSDYPVDSETSSLTKEEGEYARDTKLNGESVRSGDFIFYYYNKLDNVLNVGYNCGALKSGNLTAKNDNAKSVKIDGTTYTYEFPGVFTTAGNAVPAYNGTTISSKYLAAIEADEKNAQYVAADGYVFYVQETLNGSSYRSKHNYIITTTDPEVMAELLDTTVAKYKAQAEEITAVNQDGAVIKDTNGNPVKHYLHVSKNGYITVAVLNTSTGKWGLAEIAQFECSAKNDGTSIRLTDDVTGNAGSYDHKKDEFAFKFDIKKELKNYLGFGATSTNAKNFERALCEILNGGMFANRGKDGNVYNISVMFDDGDYGMIDSGKVIDGLYFSENGNKTNKLFTSRKDGSSSKRLTISDKTVIVVIDKDDNVGVRVGLQTEANSIIFEYTSDKDNTVTEDEKKKDHIYGSLYSGTNDLIVLRLSFDDNYQAYGNDKDGNTDKGEIITHAIKDAKGNAFDVKQWEKNSAVTTDEAYYIGLGDVSVEYEKLEDETYNFTVSGLFNLRTMRKTSSVKVNVKKLTDTKLDDGSLIGKVLHMDKSGKLDVVDPTSGQTALDVIQAALVSAVNLDIKKDEDKVMGVTINSSLVEFDDDSSISITVPYKDKDGTLKTHVLDKTIPLGAINVSVINLDISGLDLADYNVNKVVINEDYNKATDKWTAPTLDYVKGDKHYAFDLGELNSVEKINEPLAGIFDNYIIAKAGKEMYIADIDEDYFDKGAAKVTVNLLGAANFDKEDGVLNLYVVKLFQTK